jgi:hypothetical protein
VRVASNSSLDSKAISISSYVIELDNKKTKNKKTKKDESGEE